MATILVADDSVDCRDFLQHLLREEGHNVLIAASGEEAQKILREGAIIDLLITDWQMPGINGAQLIFWARKKITDLPVLMISGDYTSAIADSTFGFSIITKPFNVDVLLTEVNRLLTPL